MPTILIQGLVFNMILSNQVECLKCGDKPFSASVHDFKSCKCGNISVDGGMLYLRRIGSMSDCKEMSIDISQEAYDAALEAIKWSRDTGRNDRGLICAIARAWRDTGVIVV